MGNVIIFGERKYSMRLWIDPNKLAARQLTALDVTNALSAQNVEVAAGQLGQQPNDPKQQYQMAVQVSGRFNDPKQFDNIVIKSTSATATQPSMTNGSGLVLFKDIGRAELGAENYNTDLKFYSTQFGGGEGHRCRYPASFRMRMLWTWKKKCLRGARGVEEVVSAGHGGHRCGRHDDRSFPTPIKEVERTIGEGNPDRHRRHLPVPTGLAGHHYSRRHDSRVTYWHVRVYQDLRVFDQLADTVPGITLATGLVVDDAIVVIENVQRHLEEGAASAMEGDIDRHACEVTSAVIATSLVLISVFVPVSFFPGTTGILYKQFSLTIAFSIAISAFNALTLSPALAAILLRKETHKTGIQGFFLNPIEAVIKKIISWYAVAVTWVVKARYVFLVLFGAGLAATAFMYNHVPTAFVPQEDQGYFLILIQTPPGASLSYTSEYADRVATKVREDKDVFGTFSVMGFSLAGGSSPNSGLVFAPLVPVDQRTKLGKGHTAHDIVTRIFPQLFAVPGGVAFAAEPPAIAGIGTVGGFQFILQDGGRNTFGDIDRIAHTMVGAARSPSSGLTNPQHPIHRQRPAVDGHAI